MELTTQNKNSIVPWQAFRYKAEKSTRTSTLHLVTQEGQPYGSERRACEMCGLWVHGNSAFRDWWTDDREVYAKPTNGLKSCKTFS